MANFIELAQTDPKRAKKRLNQARAKSYFEGMMDATAMLLDEDDVCIVIGAAPGEHTFKLANSNARIIAFEPDPVAFKLLGEQLKDREKFELREQAVMVQSGKTELFREKKFDESKEHLTKFSSTVADNTNIGEAGIKVEAVGIEALIDEVFEKHGKISLILMDANGIELELLEAMKQSHLFKKVRLTLAISYQKDRPEMRPLYKSLNQEFISYPEWHAKFLKA